MSAERCTRCVSRAKLSGCARCLKRKPLTDAQRDAQRRYAKAKYAANPKAAREQQRAWRALPENREKSLKAHAEYILARRKKDPVWWLLTNVARRARKEGIEFSLQREDIQIPERCPVLGTEFVLGGGMGTRERAPSLDRIDPRKGYVPGNVQVISYRANAIKSDASVEELEALVAFLKGAA